MDPQASCRSATRRRTSSGSARRRAKAFRLPFDDPNFALFAGRRGYRVVAGGMLYRAEGVVGLSNVVADAPDAVAVWRSLILLAARRSPACRWSATNPAPS